MLLNIDTGVSIPVFFTGLVEDTEHLFLLAHGSEDRYIQYKESVFSADYFITQVLENKPGLAAQLEKFGSIYLICCHQDKQLNKTLKWGELIIPFPEWKGQNKVFLGETGEDWELAFRNK